MAAVKPPTKLTIRAYPVGFGDCFLLTFHYATTDRHVLIDFGSTAALPRQPRGAIMQIAEKIRADCGGQLDALVVTHRHQDHVSGFAVDKKGKGPGAEIAACRPKVVLQPWTEDPDAEPDALGPTRRATGARAFVASLARMHQVSASALREARTLSARRGAGLEIGKDLIEELEFNGSNNLRNRSAVETLMRMGKRKGARAVYASFGSRSGLERILPGVRCHVLGPPTLEQSEAIRDQRPRDPDEFWHLMGLSAGDDGGGTRLPFPASTRHAGSLPGSVRWFRKRVLQLRGQQLLQLVRALDEAMNNTSLILLFEIGRYRLLFPGDAQIENWSYALDRAKRSATLRRRLASVNLYKVGHHGSLNATPKSLWSMLENRKSKSPTTALWSVISTRKGKHGKATRGTEVPRTTLVKELEAETEYVTTEGTSKLDPRVIEIDLRRRSASLANGRR
jgi:Metallo-beta-lactamase superfamily